VVINWKCDLDHPVSQCLPKYEFQRLDFGDADVSPGWNFRFARHYRQQGVEFRDLYKAYGILFVITVDAKARKFSLVDLMLKIGSGIGLISLATVSCDMVILYLHRRRQYYRDSKYYTVSHHTHPQGQGLGQGRQQESVSPVHDETANHG